MRWLRFCRILPSIQWDRIAERFFSSKNSIFTCSFSREGGGENVSLIRVPLSQACIIGLHLMGVYSIGIPLMGVTLKGVVLKGVVLKGVALKAVALKAVALMNVVELLTE